MRRMISVALAATALLGVAGTAEAKRLTPQQELARLLEGRVAGEPSDCIYLPSVRSTRIVRDTAIIYDAGPILWVNHPDSGASSLDDDDIMVNRLHGSGAELWSVDVVQLRDGSTLTYTGFAGLGKFVPYRKPSANK